MSKRWQAVKTEGPRIKNHTATLVGSKMYVFGGYDGRLNHNLVHEFDCETLLWKTLSVGGEPPKGRNGHTATYAEGKIFIVGGWLGAGPLAASDLFILDLDSMMWRKPILQGRAPGACNMHTTDYVPAQRSLFVFRGGDGKRYLNDLHLLNIDTFTWVKPEVQGQLPDPRANHSSALVGSKLYIFGGWDGHKRLNDIHVLCTNTFTWSSPVVKGTPPSPRAGMSFNCVRDQLYLFGGSGPVAKCFNDLQIFDPATSTWLTIETRKDKGKEWEKRKLQHHHSGKDRRLPEDQGDRSDIDSLDEDQSCDEFDQEGESENTARGGALQTRRDNPNAMSGRGRRKADVKLIGTGPSERAGHTALLFGRKLILFGGSCVDKYLGDMFVLDTDCSPVVRVSRGVSSVDRLGSLLPSYVDSPAFSDVTFVVEGQRIHGHKMILALASERFDRMFRIGKDGSCFKEAQQKEIVIPDVSYLAFRKTLEYLYTGRLTLDELVDKVVPPAPPGLGDHREKPLLDNNENVNQRMDSYGGDIGGKQRDEAIGAQIISKAETGQVQVNQLRVGFLVELLSVADRFMLDHLKELCEEQLVAYLCKDTVDTLLHEAEFCNAQQLRNACLHFSRHVG